jgi:RHS repeat-associated protein
VYLPGTIDHPFASTVGAMTPTAIRYQEEDELNNVVGTDQAGAVSQSDSYGAWGTVTSTNSDSHLFWKGLFWSSDSTGLYFMRNRWYDPEGGRFVNEDPAGFAGGVNLYAFSGNDPVNGRDPSGLDDVTCEFIPGQRDASHNGIVVTVSTGFWVCASSGGSGGATFGGKLPAGGGGTPSQRVKPDATSVGPLAARLAAERRLTCEIRSTLKTSGAAGAVGTAVGGVAGAVEYGPAWAQIGGVSGGILATVVFGPESATAGFYAGRFAGFTAGTLYGARKGRAIAGMAGAAVGVVAGITLCP